MFHIANVFNVIIVSIDYFVCVILYATKRMYTGRFSASTLYTIIIIIMLYVHGSAIIIESRLPVGSYKRFCKSFFIY